MVVADTRRHLQWVLPDNKCLGADLDTEGMDYIGWEVVHIEVELRKDLPSQQQPQLLKGC